MPTKGNPELRSGATPPATKRMIVAKTITYDGGKWPVNEATIEMLIREIGRLRTDRDDAEACMGRWRARCAMQGACINFPE